jgi:hypothetical protein
VSDVVVRSYQPGDEDAILALFAETYRAELGIDYWRWRFRDAPAGPGVIELAWDGDVLAGHYAVTPLDLVIDGRRVATGLSGTTMTHRDYRGQGLFPLLARATYERMAAAGMEHVWGFPNTNSHRGFVETLEWKDIGEVPFFEHALEALRLPSERSPMIREVTRFEGSVDALCASLSRQARVFVHRDARYLDWRFFDQPGAAYRALVFGDEREPRAYAVYKRYTDAIQIVDVVHGDDVEPAVKLCEEIARLGREQGAQRINLWLPLRGELHRALERLGFRPTGPVTYLGARPLEGGDEAVLDPRAWHYAMADSDVY